jgi:hypothetical protein
MCEAEMRPNRLLQIAISLLIGAGCSHLRRSPSPECDPSDVGNKTLLAWVGANKEPASDKENGNETAAAGQKEEEPLASDRPDFTEASSTVGKGRIQLEAGYTFVRDRAAGLTTTNHSYPEALLRIGAFAEWLEFRIGQNFGQTQMAGLGAPFNASGADDLYLGVKLGLTEQHRILPESALILQTTVPTGHREFTDGRVLPGFNLLYGWDIIPDRLTAGGSTQANGAIDDLEHGYVQLAQSLTVGYGLTDKLSAYTEWFAFFPAGAIAPGVGSQHYFDGGFTYRVTPNFQLDIRAGVGLSHHSEDYFVGSGFAVRY